ncbi:MAG: DUF1326 domain-containing protein [Gammaproteobacteria bacterium]|nr:DUF1326 domain-containing protein [Gammaproteobacteria bacterium]
MTPWEIRTIEFANCNCAYGCPCQFNAPPTYGNCEAVVCNEVKTGHYGDISLDGIRFGGVFSWPGPIHEGGGRGQPFIDESASDAQREAILKIMSGEDTEPMTTVFSVFAAMLDEVYEPVYAPIEFDVDVEERRGRFIVPGVSETYGQPIVNPVTGKEHRARINIPDGFEYEVAEMGSGSSTTQGNIVLNLENTYGQFAHLHLNNHGVVKQ